jgi:tripartite-type tricarboxylate transporter receptor subunit TctC
MGRPRRVAPSALLAGLLLGSFHSTASATDVFPQRPVKVIVQTAAGSSIDVAARLVAEGLTRRWGQQALVFNQPGAGGAIAAKALATSSPDGYTLLLAASSIFIVLPELQKAQADDIRAFVPIVLVGEQPMAVAATADSPAKTLPDLIALAKRTPGGLNCAVSTRGGLSHLTAASLSGAANMELTFVHYPGTSQALSDVIAGRVPMVVDSLSAMVGPAAAGQIRILATAAPTRLPKLPDVPTADETLPGFAATAWLAFVAPTGTPTDLTQSIGEDVRAVLADAAVAARLEESGTFPRAMTNDQLTAFIDAERQKWAPVVQKFGAN